MRRTIVTAVAAFGLMGSVAFAQDVMVCESDPGETSARMEFQFHRHGFYVAKVLEYQDVDVAEDRTAPMNKLGLIRFQGINGIEFIANDSNNKFYVTVPGFGDERLMTAQGTCRAKGAAFAEDSAPSPLVMVCESAEGESSARLEYRGHDSDYAAQLLEYEGKVNLKNRRALSTT